jgi:hypothetical protein
MRITCKQSAVRTSELRDRHITWTRRLELWFHIVVCRFCRIYNRQIEKLGRFSRLIGEATCGSDDAVDGDPTVGLSEEAKTRIKRNLRS